MIKPPPRYVALPARIIYSRQASRLKDTYAKIIGLAWESNYTQTPDLLVEELKIFLGLAHATYFEHIGKLVKMSWLRSETPHPGCVRFTFPMMASFLQDGAAQDGTSPEIWTRVQKSGLAEEEDEEDLFKDLRSSSSSSSSERVRKSGLLSAAGVKPIDIQEIAGDDTLSLEDILANLAYVYDYATRRKVVNPAALIALNLRSHYQPEARFYNNPAGHIDPAILERAGLAELLEPEEPPDSSAGAEPDSHPPVEPVVALDPDLDQLITGSSFTARKAWQAARDQLQMELPKAAFDAWLSQAELLAYRDGAFTIGCPNAYAAMWLESRLTSTLTRLLTGICNRSAGVQFVALSLAE
jgi:hypothetical protein